MAYTFDGANKLIVLTSGTISVDLAEMWSRWKDWVQLGNAGFLRAMETVGGEDIDPGAGTRIPLFLFLQNGWKIRPQEASHTLSITGGTLLVTGGGDPIADTVGNFRVRIRYQQPVQAIGYSTTGGGGGSGASAEEVAAAVLASLNSTLIPVNVKQVNDINIQGTGVAGNHWRPV